MLKYVQKAGTATVKAGSWLMDQSVAAGRGLVKLFTKVTPTDVVPPSIASTIEWFLAKFPEAIGLDTPQKQIYASIILGIFTFLTGIVTGGAAWALIGIWVLTGLIGLLRLFPVVNGGVRRGRGPFQRVWDWFVRLVWDW